jgi:preprotein translocase subunit SecA
LKTKMRPVLGKSLKEEDFNNVLNKESANFEKAIKDMFYDFRDKRKKILDDKTNLDLEKRIFLQTIDFLWRSHLQYLEHLRSVIGLRGYAQKDPLQEFKRESFQLFEELLYKIKIDFITFLNNLEIVNKEKPPVEQKVSLKNTVKKMKRNEPCYCGSGKKFKHCHGNL